MKICVTGAAGFIGAHLTCRLLERGDDVLAIDDLSGGAWSNISPELTAPWRYRAGLTLRQWTLGSECIWKALCELMEGVEILYHLAADATEGRSQFTPWRCTRDGLLASNQVFAAAAQVGVKRVVFTSSMAVYGDQEVPFREDMEPRPVDVYGVNKAAAERCLRVLAETHGFEWVILRPHNVYGPGQNMAAGYRNVVTIFINQILKGQPLYIFGDGTQERSFTYIGDIVDGILACGTAAWAFGETFNLGAEEVTTVGNLAAVILDEMGESGYDIAYLPERPREVHRAFCSGEKWQARTCSIAAETPLVEGVRQTVGWCRTQGPQDVQYMEVEIDSPQVPRSWRDRLL